MRVIGNGLLPIAKNAMLAPWPGLWVLALFAGDEEIVDALYTRKEVQFSHPAGEGDVRFIENTEIVRFEGFNNSHLVDHWVVLDLNGEPWAKYRVDEPIEVSPKMDCKFRPGELRIGLP